MKLSSFCSGDVGASEEGGNERYFQNFTNFLELNDDLPAVQGVGGVEVDMVSNCL